LASKWDELGSKLGLFGFQMALFGFVLALKNRKCSMKSGRNWVRLEKTTFFAEMEGRLGCLRNMRKTGAAGSAPSKGLAGSFLHWRCAAAPFALGHEGIGLLIAAVLR
jgi:hypothetical protein